VEDFDLLRLSCIKETRFQRGADDLRLIAELGDLETTDNDPLATGVRGVVDCLLRDLPNSKELKARLDLSRTISPTAQLGDELQHLRASAVAHNAPEPVLSSISQLIEAAGSNFWDTSFDCALDSIKRDVAKLGQINE
jgi:hypothetical protein